LVQGVFGAVRHNHVVPKSIKVVADAGLYCAYDPGLGLHFDEDGLGGRQQYDQVRHSGKHTLSLEVHRFPAVAAAAIRNGGDDRALGKTFDRGPTAPQGGDKAGLLTCFLALDRYGLGRLKVVVSWEWVIGSVSC
jgi:hypothetical protein